MAKDLEQQLKEGRAIQDLTRSEGWQILDQRIKREIKDEYDLLRNFPIEQKGLQEIAAEYIKHRERLNAFEDVFDFIKEFLTAKENAENKSRE